MNAPAIIGDLAGFWDSVKGFVVPVAAFVPLIVVLVTLRAKKQDTRKVEATDVERLYIGGAQQLITTLQEELGKRNNSIGALEKERDQLRNALGEERQVLEILKQRHRDLITFLINAGIRVPEDLQK